MLSSRQLTKAKTSIESHNQLNQGLYIVEEDIDQAKKTMDFPTAQLDILPSRKDSINNLHIDTFTKPILPDRYESSEEEASPSPDSETESQDSEPQQQDSAIYTDEVSEATVAEEYKAEVATAVTIFVGRPKLVDITNLAPMHKRKRAEKPTLSRSTMQIAARRLSVVNDENSPIVADKVTEAATPKEQTGARGNLPSLASDCPDSWLPEEAFTIQEDQIDQDIPDLELRNPPTYNDYDPYSLNPPKLSPRNSYSSGKKPGSVARARGKTIPPRALDNGWRGLTRTISVARRQGLHRSGDWQISKKPKMIARGASEREEFPNIPTFALGHGVD